MTDQVPLDKAPPHEEEAERCLLGALLLDREVCAELVPALQEDQFYLVDHQKVFRAIRKLYDRASPVDVVLVHEEMRREGENGIPADYLVSLLESVPSSAHAGHYAHIVRQKATLRDVIAVCTKILRECYGQQVSPDQLLDRTGEIVLKLLTKQAAGESVSLHDVLGKIFDRIEALKRGEFSGLRTGFHQLDQMTSGLQKSELVIIAGRPSMGKTSLALNIASRVAIQEKVPVAIFSLEVNKLQLAQNMLCAEARVDAHQVRIGNLSEYMLQQMFNVVGRLAESPIFVQDTPSLTIPELRAQCRRLKHQHNLGAVFIDYIQLMESGDRRGTESRQTEISAISKGLKTLAREIEAPVVALSQLSRAVESREGNRPRMSDLRESGSLEQDADVILLLYREGYYKQDEDDRSAEVIVAKQRNGPTGVVRLIFNREFLRFENPTADDIM